MHLTLSRHVKFRKMLTLSIRKRRSSHIEKHELQRKATPVSALRSLRVVNSRLLGKRHYKEIQLIVKHRPNQHVVVCVRLLDEHL